MVAHTRRWMNGIGQLLTIIERLFIRRTDVRRRRAAVRAQVQAVRAAGEEAGNLSGISGLLIGAGVDCVEGEAAGVLIKRKEKSKERGRGGNGGGS